MCVISILDRNMANLIAAGEVIERPASVVKELMENSIDCGAGGITVSTEDGGRRLISISDDGCGMDGEDLAAAFEPHATSKIRTSDDLRAISTFGFRGEALASIASVARVKAASRTRDSLAGNSIEIDCSEKAGVVPCSCDVGTTVEVRDIFYRLPVRRKFLKSANTESAHITEQFIRIALPHREPAMRLIHNGREHLSVSADEGIAQRIGRLFSSQLVPAEHLVEVQSDEKNIRIYGLLGKPSVSKASSKLQYVFLNGRYIRDRFISHAIKEAYRGHLESGRHPVVFLFIEMAFADYDVNVHPTKIEVRFYNANLVHSQILAVLRERLLSTRLDTAARIPASGGAVYSEREQGIADAMAEFFKRHKPLATQQRIEFGAAKKISRGTLVEEKPLRAEPSVEAERRRFVQIHDSFIVAEESDGFVIIDQHALHERIMFERLASRISSGRLESQRLLIPHSIELTEAESEVLAENSKLVEKLGIELVPFGPRVVAIQSFPTLLSGAEPADFVRDLIDLLEEKGKALDAESLVVEVLNMAACRAAIKAGRRLSDSEIEVLLEQRDLIEHSGHCPHGRPTAIQFGLKELERQFKRT